MGPRSRCYCDRDWAGTATGRVCVFVRERSQRSWDGVFMSFFNTTRNLLPVQLLRPATKIKLKSEPREFRYESATVLQSGECRVFTCVCMSISHWDLRLECAVYMIALSICVYVFVYTRETERKRADRFCSVVRAAATAATATAAVAQRPGWNWWQRIWLRRQTLLALLSPSALVCSAWAYKQHRLENTIEQHTILWQTHSHSHIFAGSTFFSCTRPNTDEAFANLPTKMRT